MKNSFLLLVLLATSLVAAEPRRDLEPRARSLVARHFILEPEHVLSESERADLASRGCEIQQVLSEGRYLVRLLPGSTVDASDLRIRSLTHLGRDKKIHPGAYREAARGRGYARVRVLFHQEVGFDEARGAIAAAGGTLDDPLALDFELPRQLTARIPSSSLLHLADDERVFTIQGGAPRRAEPHNTRAAALSNVTSVQAAPYNLTGEGVVLSFFELGPADANHVEFGGRLKVNINPCSASDSGCASNASHATHVAGTMIAAGVNQDIRGMAPKATLHEYLGNASGWLNHKEKTVATVGSVADNNSWGYVYGWRQSSGQWTWNGGEEYIGGYDALVATLDKITRTNDVLMVHSAGNSGTDQRGPTEPPFWHQHVNDDGSPISGKTFCYSQDGSGNDCASPCSPGREHCETTRHPSLFPFGSVGDMASGKNVVAVGAVDSNRNLASFSSRGPTRDGRVKPDVVAKGVALVSTLPNGVYERSSGTSMSAPVVTGTAALLTEQWRKTMGGAKLSAATLKALLIAGASDVVSVGPDYFSGFGLIDAKASVDLIIGDGGSGKRIRNDAIAHGGEQQIGLTVSEPTTLLRVVLHWADPEVLLLGDELASKTLVNDLDVTVIDPSGATGLPYVLDKNKPDAVATQGVNSVDNTEVIEIRNPAPGAYRVVVKGTRVTAESPQKYVLIANAQLGAAQPACVDPTEPNDSEPTAFGYVASGHAVTGRICSATDVDMFKVRANGPGVFRATVLAADTPLRITLSTGATATVAAGATATVESSVSLSAPTDLFVRIEPNGTLGANSSYTLTVSYPFTTPARRRRA